MMAATVKSSKSLEQMQEYQHVDTADVQPEHTFGFLVLEDKKGRTKETFPMNRNEISFGRAMENDVRFLKAEVSRVHCKIHFSEETGEGSIEIIGSNGIELNGIHEAPSATRLPLCEGDLITICKRFFRMRYPTGLFAPLPKKEPEEQPAPIAGTPSRRRVRMSLVAAAEVYSPQNAMPPALVNLESPNRLAPEMSIRVITAGASPRMSLDHALSPSKSGQLPPSPRKSALASPTKERKGKRASFAPILEMGPTGSPLISPQDLQVDYFSLRPQHEEEEEQDLVLLEEVEDEDVEQPEEAQPPTDEAEQHQNELASESFAPEVEMEDAPPLEAEEQPTEQEETEAQEQDLMQSPMRVPSLSPRKSGRKVSLRTAALLRTSGSAYRLSLTSAMQTPLPPSPAPASAEQDDQDAGAQADEDESDDEAEVDRSLSFADSPARASSGISAGERSPMTNEEPKVLGSFMTPQVKKMQKNVGKPRGRLSVGAEELPATTPIKRGRRSIVKRYSLSHGGEGIPSAALEEEVQQHLASRLQQLEEAAEDALTDEEAESKVQQVEEMQSERTTEESPAEEETAAPTEAVETQVIEDEATVPTQSAEVEEVAPTAEAAVAEVVEEQPPEVQGDEPSEPTEKQSDDAVAPEEEQVASSKAAPEEMEEKPKRRGRAPRAKKTVAEEPTVEAEAPEPEPKKAPVKRGGNRAKAAEAEAEELPKEEAPAKKTRGKRGQAAAAAKEEVEVKEVETDEKESPPAEEPAVEEEAPAAPPKKATRGRKAKAQASAVEEPAPNTEEVVEASPTTEEPEPEPAPKKTTLGRKAKTTAKGAKAEPAQEEEAATEEPVEEKEEEQPVKKPAKRTRAAPKKGKAAAASAPALGEHDDNADANPSSEGGNQADNEASSPAKRTGRRGAAKKAAAAISDIASGVPLAVDVEGNIVADENAPTTTTKPRRTTRARRA